MKSKLLLAMVLWVSTATSAFALKGQILDKDGQPIANALVEVVGQAQSAKTDAKGYFQLDAASDAKLHISAGGYAHKTVDLAGTDADKLQSVVLGVAVLEQMDVVGIPLHASNIESAIPINIVAGEELRNKQASTLGDSLNQEVGVQSNFHGNVASTPIIRGLSGPRVLVTQNSLDVSDVSRVGPDHSVATEVSTAERIEVLRGPATLFYGSGAIGGVVNVVDQRVPTDTETRGEFQVSHDSVNNQDLASVNVNTGVENVAFHFDGFWREADEYEVPVSPEIDEDHGEREVANTAEESEGYTFGTSYLFDNGYVGISYGRLERDYGIPGHGHGEEEEHDEDEEEHEEEHEEEEVSLGLEQDRFQLISELNLDHSFVRSLNTRLGYTDYTHTEFEDGAAGTTFANETSELKLELMHQTMGDWNGGFVFDYKNTDFAATGDEAFAPPSETESFAFAVVEERYFGDVLLQLGARVEHVNINSDVTLHEVELHREGEEHGEEEEDHDEEHEEETFSFDEDYNPFSLSIGAVWDYKPGYNIGISLTHAERAPSAAELLSFGPHIATGLFEIGAIYELHEEGDEIHVEVAGGTPEMEKSNNIDITFRKFEGEFGLVLNAFYNEVENYYAEFDTGLVADVEHGHEEEGEEEEEGHGHGEELPVYIFESVDATFHGFEAQAVWQMTSSFKTTVYGDYVRGKIDDGGDLPRIPPKRLGVSFDYDYDRISASVNWTRYSDQTVVAELETETKGYSWVNAHVNYTMPFESMDLTLFLKGENLGDREARVHSSFIKGLAPRPGRNVRVGIRGTF